MLPRLPFVRRGSKLYLRDATGAAPSGPCVSCHSVSSGGQRIVASNHFDMDRARAIALADEKVQALVKLVVHEAPGSRTFESNEIEEQAVK